MPVFEIKDAQGNIFEVDAPNEELALQGFQASQQQIAPEPSQPERQQRGMLSPIFRNPETGSYELATPQIALDVMEAFKLPGETFRGELPELDPRRGPEAIQPETLGRISGAASMMAPTTPAARAALRPMEAVNKGAVRRFQRGLAEGQIPLGQTQQRIGELGPAGMAMDISPILQRKAGALASVPGQARTIVEQPIRQRGAQAGQRVAQDVAGALGTGAPASTMAANITAAQSQAAKPLYDAVRNVQIKPTGNILMVIQTPMGRRAFNKAITDAANEGTDVKGFTVGLADLAKRALDDMASSARRSGNSNEARIAGNLARTLRNAVDDAVPQYKVARDAFSGPAAVKDALETGTNIFSRNVHPAELQTAYKAMTTSERDALLQGARAALEDQMANAVNDVVAVRNILRKSSNRTKLNLLLGKDATDDLIRGMERELTFGQTATEVTGQSLTAARQVAQMESSPQRQQASRPTGVVNLLFRSFDAARNKLFARSVEQENKALAELLTAKRLPPSATRAPSMFDLLDRAAPTVMPQIRGLGVLAGGNASGGGGF